MIDHFHLEIHLTDHCNLNCANCNHFSPISKENFISIEDFKKQLMLVSKYLPTLTELYLIGGEPTLHPKFFELCQIAREIFPKLPITVFSNGIQINNWEEEQIKTIEKINIKLQIGLYPIELKKYEKLFYFMKKYKHIFYKNGRIFFFQTLIDLEGTQNAKENFLKCSKYSLPCLILKNYKIYICPFSACIHNIKNLNIIEDSSDFIPLDENITLEKLEKFCQTEKNICKYCNKENRVQIWNNSDKNLNEFIINNQELFINNYNKYFLQQNDVQKYLQYNFKDLVDENIGGGNFVNLIKKRTNGKIDIIIPFYEIELDVFIECLESLKQQTIINDCVIYFISDNSPYEKDVYNILNNYNFNYVLLKNRIRKGPGEARNLALKESYNKYIFFLDADDTLYNNNLLENLYNFFEKNFFDYDVLRGLSLYYSKNANDMIESNTEHCTLIKRENFEKFKIFFNDNYIHEDYYFYFLAKLNNLKFKRVKNIGYYVYKADSNTSSARNKDKINFYLNFIITNFFILLNYKELNIQKDKINFIANAIFDFNTIDIKDLNNFELNDFYNLYVFIWTYLINKENFNQDYFYNLFNKNNQIIKKNFFIAKLFNEIRQNKIINYDLQELLNNYKKIINNLYNQNFISLNTKENLINKGDEFLNGYQ